MSLRRNKLLRSVLSPISATATRRVEVKKASKGVFRCGGDSLVYRSLRALHAVTAARTTKITNRHSFAIPL